MASTRVGRWKISWRVVAENVAVGNEEIADSPGYVGRFRKLDAPIPLALGCLRHLQS